MEFSRRYIGLLLLILPYIVEAGGYAPAPNCCHLFCCCPSCGNNCGNPPPIGYAGPCSCQTCTGGPSLWPPFSPQVPGIFPPWRPSGYPVPIPSYPQPSYVQPPTFPPPKIVTALPSQHSTSPTVTSIPAYPSSAPKYPVPAPSYVTPAPSYVTPVPVYPSPAPSSYPNPMPSNYPTQSPSYASPSPYVQGSSAPWPSSSYAVAPIPPVPCGGPCNCAPCPGFWQRIWNFFTHGWGLALLIASLVLLILLCILLGALMLRRMQQSHNQHHRHPMHATVVHPVGTSGAFSQTVNQSPTRP